MLLIISLSHGMRGSHGGICADSKTDILTIPSHIHEISSAADEISNRSSPDLSNSESAWVVAPAMVLLLCLLGPAARRLRATGSAQADAE